MFEFEIVQKLEVNDEILEIIKNYEYTVKNGNVKHLKATNLQFIDEYKVRFKYILWFLIKVVKVKLKQDYLCNFI